VIPLESVEKLYRILSKW